MNNFKNRKGFTIVELVIVIAVIAILAGVLIPTFSGVVSKANESAAVQTTRTALSNVLSGNVKNGVLNAAEFVINNGSKTYQFSYANGQLITEDKDELKAGDDNVGTNLTLKVKGETDPVVKTGDTNICGYKNLIVKEKTLDDKSKAAIAYALGMDPKLAGFSVTIADDEKTITITNGATTDAIIISYNLYYNGDFADNIVAFIK